MLCRSYDVAMQQRGTGIERNIDALKNIGIKIMANCTCVSKPPFWYEDRCSECLAEDAKIWADAMAKLPQIIERLKERRGL